MSLSQEDKMTALLLAARQCKLYNLRFLLTLPEIDIHLVSEGLVRCIIGRRWGPGM